MKQTVWLLILLVALLPLISCAAEEPKTTNSVIGDEETSAEVSVTDQPTAEPIYVYGAKRELPNNLSLKLVGEPILFPSGYVRLAGVVSGLRPVALLEVGGKGLALREGEEINDYRIAGINGDCVVLERRK